MSETVIGTLTVGEGVVYHDQTGEVAAWWTDYAITPGEYPVVLRSGREYWDQQAVHVKVPGTIVDEYHASLYFGVPIGPTRKDGVGQTSNRHFMCPKYVLGRILVEGEGRPFVVGTFTPLPGLEGATVTFTGYDGEERHTTALFWQGEEV